MKQLSSKTTLAAGFTGYVVQAAGINFTPLLFMWFNKELNISLEKITLIVTISFIVQLLVDILSVKFTDRIGYRTCAILSNAFSFTGFVLLAFLPFIMKDSYAGIITAVIFYSIGGGLTEVVISPLIEACPTKNKERTMSLLHSVYSWGSAGVIILSSIFFAVFGIENWRILILIYSAIPLFDLVLFTMVPIYTLQSYNGKSSGPGKLFKSGIFLLLLLMMICSGASEHVMAQWSSFFAESTLKIPKTVGDIAGPAMFAVTMALSRTFSGRHANRKKLPVYIGICGVLCTVSFLVASLSPIPVLGLAGCILSGFAVGIFWPGTYSIAASEVKGGTPMFALLALAGDIGCTLGPTYSGFISAKAGGNIGTGILFSAVFPVILTVCILFGFIKHRRSDTH